MTSSVLIISSVLTISTVLISGNVIPIPDKTFSKQWIPKEDHRNVHIPEVQQKSVKRYTAYQQPIIQTQHHDNVNPVESANFEDHRNLPAERNEQQLQHQVHNSSSKAQKLKGTTGPETTEIQSEFNLTRQDEFQEKLGFGILSSLLPTSILNSPQASGYGYENNQVETDSNQVQLVNVPEIIPNVPQFQQPDPDNNQDSNVGIASFGSSLLEPFMQFQENSQEDDSESGNGLFSRLRNVLPFGNGFISGLLSNENNNSGEETAADTQDNDGGTSYNLQEIGNSFHQDDPGASRPLQDITASDPGTFLPDLGQTSLTNQETGHDQPAEVNDSSESGSSFLSSLPNPFTRLKDLFSSITTPLVEDNIQESESAGGYVNESNDPPADSAISPLQSLADGGFSGALGVIVPYLSQLLSALGIAKAKLPLIKLLGAVIGPIIAAAIASIVIGTVYLAIYIPSTIIQNENVDGEMYLLNIRQLLDILGIPDPLDVLFGRSFKGRSLESRSLKITDSQKRLVVAGNSTEQKYQCMERMACHAIGKKLAKKPSWKDGWFQKGIRWVAVNVHEDSFDWGPSSEQSSYYKVIRNGKSLIDAIAVGMTSQNKTDNSVKSNSVCERYTCDPLVLLKTLFERNPKVPISSND